MDAMTIVTICLAVAYIAFIFIQHFYTESKRKTIKTVIHVNGIRGKSTVTRLIIAGLKNCNLKVFGKTTGTIPTIIDTNNVCIPIKRKGPANIREQLKMISLAAKQNADVLVLECMAVNPELQFMCEHRILHSDITVITNVRADHLDQMGNSLESIAYSLANTIPDNRKLILGEDKCLSIFQRCADKCKAKVIVAKPYDGEELLDTFSENIAVALEVCRQLGVNEEAFFEGMCEYIPDPGALATIVKENSVFINGFSINDPESILRIYMMICQKYDASKITILLNERADRPFRLEQHIEMLKQMKYKKVIIVGSNLSYTMNKLSKIGIVATTINDTKDLLQEEIIFGCGNIADNGLKIIDFFTKGK